MNFYTRKLLIKSNNNSIVFGFTILLLVFLFSCKNDMVKVNMLNNFLIEPVESAKDITVIRSDSGNVQVYMTSKQLDRYEGEQAITKFPKGLKVIFYDKLKQVKTILTANYAINYEDRKVMEVQNNVKIVDVKKGDTIYTEQITWDINRRLIFSSSFVRRIAKDGSILYGDGFDSDDNFEKYTLRRPRGTFNIDKDQ